MSDLNNDLEARRAAALAFAEAAEYLENLNLDLVELDEDGACSAPVPQKHLHETIHIRPYEGGISIAEENPHSKSFISAMRDIGII